LLRNEPHRDRATLERTRDLMDSATRDSLITGYESLIPSLELPDPDDRHVLAAAIVVRCDVILTQNLKDFPDEAQTCPSPARHRFKTASGNPPERSIAATTTFVSSTTPDHRPDCSPRSRFLALRRRNLRINLFRGQTVNALLPGPSPDTP
jgi:hypothetical protein